MKWVRNRFRQFTGFLVFFSKNIDGYEINMFHSTYSPLMFNRRLHRLWSILNPKWDQGTKSERNFCGIPDGIGIPANFAGIHFFGIFRRNFSEWIGTNFFEKIPPE